VLTGKDLELAIGVITGRLDDVNTLYIKKIASQIKKIGELGQSNINRIVSMVEMGADINDITDKLQVATGLNEADLRVILEAAMDDVYTDKRFSAALNGSARAPEIKAKLSRYTQMVSEQTAEKLQNLSNTTAVKDNYKEAIDKAVLSVSTGVTDYKSATRDVVRSLGYNGLQVYYESGYHRRLDTAARQNIIDATNQIAQHGADMIGEELGYDAVEISAHANSAPDHEPVQGRVFILDEYKKLQSGLSFKDVDGIHYIGIRRPISEWNCGHFAVPFDTKTSVRRYTDNQLANWKQQNHEGCEIDGKHYTMYEASQLMREVETEVRRWKDTAVAARIAGDDTLRRQCQKHINTLGSKYAQIAEKSGLPTKRQRMSVEGFKAVKIREATLKNASGHDIIPVGRTTVKGQPDSITQVTSKKGGISRNYYDSAGIQIKQISNNDHGHTVESHLGKHGEHAHDYYEDKNGKIVHGRARELTDAEREENDDIL